MSLPATIPTPTLTASIQEDLATARAIIMKWLRVFDQSMDQSMSGASSHPQRLMAPLTKQIQMFIRLSTLEHKLTVPAPNPIATLPAQHPLPKAALLQKKHGGKWQP